MRKFISASPLAGLAIVLSICTISFFLVSACRKTDRSKEERSDSATIEKFFQLKPGTDPVVEAIAASIKRQDMQRHFVPKLTKKAGFALWDKAKVMTKDSEDGQQIFIPFALEDKKQTKAMLIVKLNGADTLYHLLYGSQARQYGFDSTSKNWNAKDIFNAFILFDYEIFGHKRFNVKESRLLDTKEPGNAVEITKVFTPGSGNRLQTFYPVTVWTTYVICGSCGQQQREAGTNRSKLCCNAQYVDIMVTYWFDDSDGSFGWYTPAGYEEGGGAPCPGCSWEDTNPCELDGQGHAVSFCNEDWEPETNVELEFYDPYKADTVKASAYLRDSFPCTYSFIIDSMTNANVLAQLAGTDVFNDAAFMHLTFDTSAVYTTSTQPSGITIPGPVWVAPNGFTHYKAIIKLNPWHLKHATKEYMVSTIVHECLHAIFSLRWGQYKNWLINHDSPYDSAFIKTHFPLHWYYITGQTVPLTDVQDHELMAAEYAQKHDNIVRTFYNPGALNAVRDSAIKAMGYGGLHNTSAWKHLPAMGIDTCKYKAIQIAAEQAATGNLTPTGCSGSYNKHYINDLQMRSSCN